MLQSIIDEILLNQLTDAELTVGWLNLPIEGHQGTIQEGALFLKKC